MKKKHVIVIVGPTAIGKTETAIKLAEILKTEIISADSRQVFKEMNIGTQKPNSEQLNTVKHHFIGNKSVTEYYNASIYEKEANETIEKLFAENDKVIVAGGSGLYIDALLFGIDNFPTIDPQLRKDLQQKYLENGIEHLRIMLKKLDKITYNNIDLKNHKRILKTLEVTIQTGKPYSKFLTGKKKIRNYTKSIFYLQTNRQKLYDKINQRVENMIKNGLVEEVRKLAPYRDLNPLKTIGYKEIFDHIDGKTSLQEAVTFIQNNTRKYARKQMSWFNRYKDAKIINAKNPVQEIKAKIKN